MLRTTVIAAAAILTFTGVGLVACGVHVPGWQAVVIGVVVLIGTLFERWRYRRIQEPLEGPWQQTGERFFDPSTGDPVDVMFDPRTGARRYVAGKSRGANDPAP